MSGDKAGGAAPLRRLQQLSAVLDGAKQAKRADDDDEGDSAVAFDQGINGARSVTIGDVTVAITSTPNPESVPEYTEPLYEESQEVLRHLRWIMQKDRLGQDVFLLGPPGPMRRALAMRYAQLTNREIEYVPLSKDVTDGDLKQRREIAGGSAFYVDQACVRAATEGRILILDGIEKAERNVLPIINNLLENREMSLEDGRFLVHPKRFDTLAKDHTKEEIDNWKLVRVSDRFYVIALGLPVPRYEGYPLDPPLRSRFQSRSVGPPNYSSQLDHLHKIGPNVPRRTLERLVSLSTVIRTLPREASVVVPEYPLTVERAVKILEKFPGARERWCVDVTYPWTLLPNWETEKRRVVEAGFQRFGFLGDDKQAIVAATQAEQELPRLEPGYRFVDVQKLPAAATVDGKRRQFQATVRVRPVAGNAGGEVTTTAWAGPYAPSKAPGFVDTDYHSAVVTSMIMCHAAFGDFCVVGEKGAGKSACIRAFAKALGYRVEFIPLYKDMSARDLLQRRSTTLSGDTIWEMSPLVKAALDGSLAILDSADAVPPATLSTIARLISEREMPLPDGTFLVSHKRYASLMRRNNWSVQDMTDRRCFPIHPAFRIVALARPNTKWLNEEMASMMGWVVMRNLNFDEEMFVIHTLCPGADDDKLTSLIKFSGKLRSEKDDVVQNLSQSLSTRQLLRIARRISAFSNESLFEAIHKVALSRFLPSLVKTALDQMLEQNGIEPPPPVEEEERHALSIQVLPSPENPEALRIGDVEFPIAKDTNPLLIPDIVFHDNLKQTEILREMLKDWKLGEHLLLIGNQGVGKNKLSDKFLQLLRLPREYIQLHRDTTVQSLTSTPSIVDGVLQYEDSPLVKAVREGFILVVDEADKAPTHVTAILKTLVEDGEMVLSDGRRIVSKLPEDSEAAVGERGSEYIVVHPMFRMIVLANRPGFPFLGNDFYREIGDVFSSHSIDNPDQESELALLRKYAPHVPEDVLVKLTTAFNDLRRLVDEGLISYPYSTRELVNIVRHLEEFPREGLSRAVRNVFDFDQYEKETKDLLIETLQKNGIPAGMESEFKIELGIDIKLSNAEPLELWERKPAQASDRKACEIDAREINARGGWPIVAPKAVEDLERVESRSVVFTEQVYSFKIPTRGEALDVIAGEDGTLFIITTSPVTLHVVAPDHRRLLASIDLYEYFPLQKASMQLRIAMLGSHNLCIHNPIEHSLLILDLQSEKIISVLMPGFEPHPTSFMVKSLAKDGILVFYQETKSVVVVLDFNENMQYNIRLPFRVAGVSPISRELWIVQSYDYTFDKRQSFLLSRDPNSESWIPGVVETLRTSNARDESRVPQVLHVSEELPGLAADGSDARFVVLKEFDSFCTTVSGLPDAFATDAGGRVELLSHIRDPAFPLSTRFINLRNVYLELQHTGQLAAVVPTEGGRNEGFLEIANPRERRLRRIKIPLTVPVTIVDEKNIPTSAMYGQSHFEAPRSIVSMVELGNSDVLTLDLSGVARVWQVKYENLVRDANSWKRLVGSLDEKTLRIIYGEPEGEGDGSGKGQGRGEGEGEGEGSGQGQGRGEGQGEGEGSGGGGGGGSGGERGEGDYELQERESGTIDLENFAQRTADQVPPEVSEATREMHNLAMRKRLEQLDMSDAQMEVYARYMGNVQREIRELRVTLEAVEAKNKERVWLKNQISGDVDDTKLIEGITGERSIYKRRGETDEIGMFQQKPKRMIFAFDLSASMMRFNGHDARLDRSLEVALMIMESFKNFEQKFQYVIRGHSGDSASVPFVDPPQYPSNEKDVFQIIARMSAHANYCLSGDNTLSAASTAIKDVVKEEGDDYFVVVISDANIQQYNITPSAISKVLKSDDRVNAHMIFIGSLGGSAEKMQKTMGSGAHVCLDSKDLPRILKSIFLSSMTRI
ncbi:AAA domain-containing protein [Hyaloraphidium curvatum]|nr:AAA domain-containing protein [Hyaloraphidium curvatum]